MTTAKDRGWGNPTDPGYAKNIVDAKGGGITLRVHKDIAPIIELFLTIITAKGYTVAGKIPDDWGFCLRPVRGYERRWKLTHLLQYLSNHSWGLAIDLNSTTNPMTQDGRVHTNMPAFVIDTARSLGLEWGGDYHGDRRDPMHFEWTGTPAGARAKVEQLRAFLGAKR